VKIKIISFCLVLLLFLGVFLSSFIAQEGEFIIITQFGKAVRIIREPGLYFKLPGFLHNVNRFDKRANVFRTQPIQLLLKDKNPIIFTIFVCWRVSEPLLFFESVNTVSNSEQKLGDLVNSQLGNVLGSYSIDNIINTQEEEVKLIEIESKILKNANQKIKNKYGIEILDIGISRIAYPAIVTDAVYERMRSERAKEANKYRAEGREEAVKIQAKTDKEVSEILSNAYMEAQIIKGEGDKEAMRIYAESYGKDVEFFHFFKSLESYKEILGEKTTLVFSTDSELFKYLNLRENLLEKSKE